MPTRITYGEPSIAVYEIASGTTLTVYRVVRSDNTDDPVFLNSMKSHYELAHRPPGPVRPTVLHMGVSTYYVEEAARETALRWPQIGGYVAKLALREGNGFNWAMTGHTHHITIWGDPVKLAAATVDIVEV